MKTRLLFLAISLSLFFSGCTFKSESAKLRSMRAKSNITLSRFTINISNDKIDGLIPSFEEEYLSVTGFTSKNIPERLYERYEYKDFIHPFDANGYYKFDGQILKTGKKLNPSVSRITMEIYDWEKYGDGKVAVGFLDGHIELWIPNVVPAKFDSRKFLSTAGHVAVEE